MPEQHNPSSGTFMKAFVPGLVLGLIVGGLAGAVLVPMLGEGPKLSNAAPANPSKPSRLHRASSLRNKSKVLFYAAPV